jgi:hypothetical protein
VRVIETPVEFCAVLARGTVLGLDHDHRLLLLVLLFQIKLLGRGQGFCLCAGLLILHVDVDLLGLAVFGQQILLKRSSVVQHILGSVVI